jgi:hypothetical protein
MTKANKHDYRGAIADYSAAVEAEDDPSDVTAMVLYNRALAYSAIDETDKAADDLEAVLRMPEVSKRVATAALRRQARVQQRREKENRDSQGGA